MSTLLHTYILLIGCLSPIMLFAQKHYTKQSVYPITNFAWDENDISSLPRRNYYLFSTTINGQVYSKRFYKR